MHASVDTLLFLPSCIGQLSNLTNYPSATGSNYAYYPFPLPTRMKIPDQATIIETTGTL
jgi:hypothetical protein